MTEEEYQKFIEKEYQDFVAEHSNRFIQPIHNYIDKIVPSELTLATQIGVKVFMIIFIFVLVDRLCTSILLPIIKKVLDKKDATWSQVLIKTKVFNSIIHLIPTILCWILIPYIFYHHPKSFRFSTDIFNILMLLIFSQLISRVISIVEYLATDDNNYRTIAVRSFGQLTRLMGIIFIVLFIISIIFKISFSQIVTVIGGITAVLLLVFRDPILGFVAGIHAASSKMIKTGDWVYFPKYNLEGYIKEINLISVKVKAFDNTVSTIPTYDLISSEVKNFEPMLRSKKRQIKRSIFFNINSFKFVDDFNLERFSKMNLLQDYIKGKKKEIDEHNQLAWLKQNIYERQLTNIGLFRIYIENYLKNNPKISQTEILMVRQREISPQGLPLEIFCFTNTSNSMEYEDIQSDIFDYILTSAKEFDLDIVQQNK